DFGDLRLQRCVLGDDGGDRGVEGGAVLQQRRQQLLDLGGRRGRVQPAQRGLGGGHLAVLRRDLSGQSQLVLAQRRELNADGGEAPLIGGEVARTGGLVALDRLERACRRRFLPFSPGALPRP